MPSEHWVDLVQGLLSDLPRRRKSLVTLMVLFLVAGGVVGTQLTGAAVVVVSSSLLVLGSCTGALLLVDTFRDYRTAGKGPTATFAARPVGGRQIIGVSIERGSLVCGLVTLSGHPQDPVGRLRLERLGRVRELSWSNPRKVYTLAAHAIGELAEESGDRGVDGIGIAMPGLVDIAHGELQSSPAGLPPGHVPLEISSVLADRHPQVARALGIQGSFNTLAGELSKRVLIDNDSRCIGRYILNSSPPATDFVSMYVGKGVGSAIVLDRRMYFGGHGFAGEYGHQVLGLGQSVLLSGSGPGDGTQLQAVACDCGREGAHYETLINDAGVLRLAAHIDQGFFDVLDANLARGKPWDLASASLLQVTEEVLSGEEGTPGVELCKRLAQGDYGRVLTFFSSLRDTYAQLLTVGVANLVNTLDLTYIYLCGPLIERFDRLPGFREKLKAEQIRYVFRENRVRVQTEHGAAEQAWMGAALLFRDPAYAEACGLRPEVDEDQAARLVRTPQAALQR
jgi:predicted NBD/HSP70 family sugar kinase